MFRHYRMPNRFEHWARKFLTGSKENKKAAKKLERLFLLLGICCVVNRDEYIIRRYSSRMSASTCMARREAGQAANEPIPNTVAVTMTKSSGRIAIG